MPTFSPHFKVGIGETATERGDLNSTLVRLANAIAVFGTDPARLNGACNRGLDDAHTEIVDITNIVAGFDTNQNSYTVNAVTRVIARAKALRKTLRTVRATIPAAIQPYYDTEILGTVLDQAIDAADEFHSKAIGGIINHTKIGVGKALKGTVKIIKKNTKPALVTLGVGAGLVAGGFAAKKGYEAAFVAPGAHPSPELVENSKFNFRNLFETYLVHNGGEKNIDATSFDNFWGALRDETASRARQAGKMADGITLEGTEPGDTLVIYADKEGDREVITLSARDKKEGKEVVDMWYREGGQIMHKTGKTGSQYASTTRAAIGKIFENRAQFIGQ